MYLHRARGLNDFVFFLQNKHPMSKKVRTLEPLQMAHRKSLIYKAKHGSNFLEL
jgi:tRNA U38,U39,U40 pseudouridine synthase TruA